MISPGDIYGVLTVFAVLSAWASRNHVIQQVGLFLLCEWAFSNIGYALLGAHQAMLVIPSVNAVLATLCAIIGFKNKSRLALVVFILYGFVGVTHVLAFASRKDGTYAHYLALNVLFALQLLSVGGAGAWMAIRRWVPRRSERVGAHSPRRESLA